MPRMKTPLSPPSTARRLVTSTVACSLLFIAGIRAARPVFPAEGPVTRITQTCKVDEVGDCRFKVEITTSAAVYTSIKTATPNIAALMRRLGWGQEWAKLEDVHGRFDDNTSSLVYEYLERGLGRSEGDSRWSARIAEGAKVDLVSSFENTMTFAQTANTALGLTSGIVHIELPEACSDVRFARSPDRVTYTLPAPKPTSGKASVEFTLDAKPHVMSSLAKSYANTMFSRLWVARSVLRNTGSQELKDYRVRFRIAGYSSWSRWCASKTVLPGQTVVDPFFPMFDLEKVAALDSPLTTAVETEYEYTDIQGNRVSEVDTERVRLLGRNQVVYSSMDIAERVGFHDSFNYGPLILASFVTHDDPVMQQLAGAVSGLAGGVAASRSDQESLAFLESLFVYLSDHKVAYQTPPGGAFEGQLGQHLKYGRDVLRNRAGTCIDLAILFASAADAVGLKPVLFLVPGHCFPGVILPSGAYVAVEATMIGRATFDQAKAKGFEQMKAAQSTGLFYLVNVGELHDQGVDCLDLPKVAPDYLESLGYAVNLHGRPAPRGSGKLATTRNAPATGSGSPQSDSESAPRPGPSPAPTPIPSPTPAPSPVPSPNPIPTPDPGTVPPGRRGAFVKIVNPLRVALKYEIRWGEGNWDTWEVPAGQWMWHRFLHAEGDQNPAPPVIIRFDSSFAEGLQLVKYTLQSTEASKPSEPTIARYKFDLASHDGSAVNLFFMR